MKLNYWLIPLAWASCSAAHAATLGPPLAQAASGQMQCYTPNTTAKTCGSLAGYAIDRAGTIQNTAIVMISAEPLVVMTAVSPVAIKGGKVCGPIRAADLESAHFTVAGKPATADQEGKLRQLIIGAETKLFGHEICTDYVPEDGAFTAKATDNGVPQPQIDQKVIWVSPADGYRVGP